MGLNTYRRSSVERRASQTRMVWITVGAVLVCGFLALMLPHWLRVTGTVVGKQFTPAWVQVIPAHLIHHNSWTETETSTDSYNHKHTYTTFHAAYDEHVPEARVHHPDVWTLLLTGDKSVEVDAATWGRAAEGDLWGHKGFYSSQLIKVESGKP